MTEPKRSQRETGVGVSVIGKRYAAIGLGVLLSLGVISFVSSILFSSSVLAFIGLGLTFWAAIMFYIRPVGYVQFDLVNSTVLSSLQALDRFIAALGYSEKAVYIPWGELAKTIVFIPAKPLVTVPTAEAVWRETFTKDPEGLVILPPGIGLARLVERRLGAEFKKLGLEKLRSRLPKLLIEDLELVKDFDMRVDGNIVRFTFVDSIYSELCGSLRESTRLCSMVGCPISSAMTCMVADVSGKPVVFEEDTFSEDGRTIVSSCRTIQG